jgi:hypothetical protein
VEFSTLRSAQSGVRDTWLVRAADLKDGGLRYDCSENESCTSILEDKEAGHQAIRLGINLISFSRKPERI